MITSTPNFFVRKHERSATTGPRIDQFNANCAVVGYVKTDALRSAAPRLEASDLRVEEGLLSGADVIEYEHRYESYDVELMRRIRKLRTAASAFRSAKRREWSKLLKLIRSQCTNELLVRKRVGYKFVEVRPAYEKVWTFYEKKEYTIVIPGKTWFYRGEKFVRPMRRIVKTRRVKHVYRKAVDAKMVRVPVYKLVRGDRTHFDLSLWHELRALYWTSPPPGYAAPATLRSDEIAARSQIKDLKFELYNRSRNRLFNRCEHEHNVGQIFGRHISQLGDVPVPRVGELDPTTTSAFAFGPWTSYSAWLQTDQQLDHPIACLTEGGREGYAFIQTIVAGNRDGRYTSILPESEYNFDSGLISVDRRADWGYPIRLGRHYVDDPLFASIRDERAMATAALSLSAGRGKGEPDFIALRSLGELKDFRSLATPKEAQRFLRWCRSKSGPGWLKISIRAAASAYLSWRFAIEPTAQDIQTLCDNSLDFLLSTSRTLDSLLRGVNTASTLGLRQSWQGPGYMSYRRRLDRAVPYTFDDSYTSVQEFSTVLTSTYSDVPFSYDSSIFDVYSCPDTCVEKSGYLIEHFNTSMQQPVWCLNKAPTVDVWRDGERIQNQPLLQSPTWIVGEDAWNRYLSDPGQWFRQQALYRDSMIQDGFRNQAYRCDVAFRNAVAGLVFARFRDDGKLAKQQARLDSVRSRYGNTVASLMQFGQSVSPGTVARTAWELFPLSFVLDWFADSGTVVRALQSLLDSRTLGRGVMTDEGCWASMHSDLWAAVRYPDVVAAHFRVQTRAVPIIFRMRNTNTPTYYWYLTPVSQRVTSHVTCRGSSTGELRPTGLRARCRGEFDLDLSAFVGLYPSIRLDWGKLKTLVAMLSGFLAA